MKNARFGLIALCMVLCFATSAPAQVSIGIGLPNVSIGINIPLFPELAPVPGYPVYYAPQLEANYFFYDGMYWVYSDDNWYASHWYNGPWSPVEPIYVPVFILRVPVRYYRHPPVYFRGWKPNAPPRWGTHWGPNWEQRRRGWNRWNRSSVPPRAPLPLYQRQYSGDKYPRIEHQRTLRQQHYRYQPRDSRVRRQYERRMDQKAPAPAEKRRMEGPVKRSPMQRNIQRSTPPGKDAPALREERRREGGVRTEGRAPGVKGSEKGSRVNLQGRDVGRKTDQERSRGRNK